ncbi:unnamed protein product [Paramecium sonneborni]|uniref:Uncharacterized protein n=1 Tax=Paramecium sonneborni TaxID=65129 RepID=A0A8S1MZE3_9CILI|nr:unnamed protein product [Paramecium sonneborni]
MGCSAQKQKQNSQEPPPKQYDIEQQLALKEEQITHLEKLIEEYKSNNKHSLVEVKMLELDKIKKQRDNMIKYAKVNVIIKCQVEDAQAIQGTAENRVKNQKDIITMNDQNIVIKETEIENANRINDQRNDLDYMQQQENDVYSLDKNQTSQINSSAQQQRLGTTVNYNSQAKITQTNSSYQPPQQRLQSYQGQKPQQIQKIVQMQQ